MTLDIDSTATDVLAGIDLHGKLALVTGGSSGLGLAATRALAAAGAHVVVPARHPAPAQQALEGIEGVEVDELDLLRALNRVRAQSGLRPLVEDWHLCAAARHHSAEMVARNVFGHGAFAWRMAHFHVRGPHFGEALAWGEGPLGTSDAIVNAWLNSPEHRALLLSPVFRRVGVGEADGPFAGTAGATVATADFAG